MSLWVNSHVSRIVVRHVFVNKMEYFPTTVLGNILKLDVEGFAPCHAEAKSKKDAQTLAAWEFAEYLVSCGKMARGWYLYIFIGCTIIFR